MTSSNPTRRPVRRAYEYGTNGNGRSHGRSGVGDKLREARELRGLDLYRVERDTKIRHKFLEALEAGEYAELPGDVYARGFLRNYASYLGLDADEIIDEWRQESGPQAGAASLLAAPKPIVLPRRGFFLQTWHLILVGVLVVVGTVGIFLGYQVTRFLSYPSVKVTSPTIATVTVPLGSTTYTLTGVATAGATVVISWNGQEATTLQADDSGHWSYQATLRPGQNEFDVVAKNLDTNHESPKVTILILVPTPAPTAPTPVVAFLTPAANATISDGNVKVTGSSSTTTNVTLTTTYIGPPPAPGATVPPYNPPTAVPSAAPASGSPAVGPSISPSALPAPSPAPGASSAPKGPGPITVATDASGNFSFAFSLDPGLWAITLTGSDGKGHSSAPVSRQIAVPFTGVQVVISINGAGGSWLKYWRDGVAIQQSTFPTGWSATVTAKKSVCVYAGAPSRVFLTINGVAAGAVNSYGGSRVYIDAAHGPRLVAVCG